MYALASLPGNLSMTIQHIAPAIHPPEEGEVFSGATTTTPEPSSAEKASLSLRNTATKWFHGNTKRLSCKAAKS